MDPTSGEAATEVLAYARAMARQAPNGWDFTCFAPGAAFPPLRLRSLRVLAETVLAGGELDPAAVYGGNLAAPLCCCRRGLMCAGCGTGHHWECPDREDTDYDARNDEDEEDED